MRLSYTDIKTQYLINIGHPGSSNTSLLSTFNLNLGQRYQLALAKLQDYTTNKPHEFITIAGQQYYPYPVGIQSTDTLSVTVGSVSYPLTTIYDQSTWNVLNSMQLQPTAIPQFIFPRSSQFAASEGGGFGIWPIPQAEYVSTLNYYIRDRNLSQEDYTTGTVTMTLGDATIIGAGGATFIPAMVGRWLTVTSATSTGQGYDYLVSEYTDSTHIELWQPWTGATGSSLSYRIGESPLLPDEGQTILIDGTTADFYAGPQADVKSATWFNNKFWTGDGQNSIRDEGDENISGGLINLINIYGGRDDKRLIKGQPRVSPAQWKIWATTLSS